MSSKLSPPPWRPSHDPHESREPRTPAPNKVPIATRGDSAAERSGVVPRTSDFEHFVRVDRNGRVLTGQGRVEELAALCAYTCRMSDLIGELLQFGPAVALEASFSGSSVFVYRDAGGEIVGIKPHPRMSLRHLRARLNL
jgi:hypothetical protein